MHIAGARRPVAQIVSGKEDLETNNFNNYNNYNNHNNYNNCQVIFYIMLSHSSDWRGPDQEEKQGVRCDQEWDGGERKGKKAAVQKCGLASDIVLLIIGLFVRLHPWNVVWSIYSPWAGESLAK